MTSKKTSNTKNGGKSFSIPDLPPLDKLQWLLEHIQTVGISPYLVEAKKLVLKIKKDEVHNA